MKLRKRFMIVVLAVAFLLSLVSIKTTVFNTTDQRLDIFEFQQNDKAVPITKRFDDKVKEKLEDEGTFCQGRNIGCFESLPNFNEKLVTKLTFNLMSVKWCISFCASQKTTYAGLKRSTICVCSKKTPQDFVDLKTSSMKCSKTCPGNSKENCGGETSFNVYRVSSPCVKAPFSEDFVQSRNLGCFSRPSMVTSFVRYESESSNDCLFVCGMLKHPLAVFDGRKECLCGKMTDRFNLRHKLIDCNAINSVHVYRTTVPDERCENIRFLPPSVANRTLLTSFPGSGNTWTRYLLEGATGYYTGCVYTDKDLIETGFVGESMDPSEYRTGIIKDHLFGNKRPPFEQTILVIRNPYHAMKAEFNRMKTNSHIQAASKDVFDKGFEKFFNNNIDFWKSIITKVLQTKWFNVFYFEDLVANPIETTREMVKFLANPALHPTNLDDRLACLSQQTTGESKRKSSRQSFDLFTPKLKKSLNSAIKEMRELLQKSGVKKSLPQYEIPF